MTSSHDNGRRKCPKFKRGCSSFYYLQTVYNVLMLMDFKCLIGIMFVRLCALNRLLTFHKAASFFSRVVSYDHQLSHFVG